MTYNVKSYQNDCYNQMHMTDLIILVRFTRTYLFVYIYFFLSETDFKIAYILKFIPTQKLSD